MDFPYRSALIVGTGPGISASLARRLAGFGVKIALAARNVQKLDALIQDTGAQAFAADAASPESVARLFDQVRDRIGAPEIVVYNAGARAQGPLAELDPEAVQNPLTITAFGAVHVAQQTAKRMVPLGRGPILCTGATASVKGLAHSAS